MIVLSPLFAVRLYDSDGLLMLVLNVPITKFFGSNPHGALSASRTFHSAVVDHGPTSVPSADTQHPLSIVRVVEQRCENGWFEIYAHELVWRTIEGVCGGRHFVPNRGRVVQAAP